MPITPFHFGPGVALHAVAPRQISFLAFCATNVLIDGESLYNMVNHRYPVHAFFHTCVGATLAAVATVGLFAVLRSAASSPRVPDLLGWKGLTVRQVGAGAILGAYTHVVLDSVTHADLYPLAPLSTSNPLLGVIPRPVVLWVCVVAGVVGLVVVGARKLLANSRVSQVG
jgi:hypothetical protein